MRDWLANDLSQLDGKWWEDEGFISSSSLPETWSLRLENELNAVIMTSETECQGSP
jgi:hypothetical protein